MYGKEKLLAWRREMMAAPPPMNEAHPYYQPPPAPLTESLYDCQKRVIRYWHDTIVPEMAFKENLILIAAHANTIR
jgi:2,3-bisphosphoglycerate-dependent phosphoglycerate mutase